MIRQHGYTNYIRIKCLKQIQYMNNILPGILLYVLYEFRKLMKIHYLCGSKEEVVSILYKYVCITINILQQETGKKPIPLHNYKLKHGTHPLYYFVYLQRPAEGQSPLLVQDEKTSYSCSMIHTVFSITILKILT